MSRFATLLALLLIVPAANGQPKDQPALKGNDPVELVAGKELPGDPSRTVVQGRFTYRFANEANKVAFQKEPEKYGIQFDGACMKMGPLSGGGSADRWDVYGGRIYVFASENCRTAFRAAPDNFVDKADEAPKGTDAEKKAAAVLLGKAVAAVGGAKALGDATTYQITYRYDGKSGDQPYTYRRYLGVEFDGPIVSRETYEKSVYGWVLTARESHHTGPSGWEAMSQQVREFCLRDVIRHPVCILKAWAGGMVTAFAAGADKVGDVAVERVAVHLNGATTTLAIDPTSGRVLRATYRGRGAGPIATVEKTFSDFRAVDGLTLPFGVATTADGKPIENPKMAVESIRVNVPIPPEYLKK